MPRLNFLGFQTGENVTISASQNGEMSGSLLLANWGNGSDTGGGTGGGTEGGTGTGTGGTITILADRSMLQCAPDSVGFSVDLSAAGFDTPAPAAGEIYDARLHDLIYVWDFGDSGTWSAPVNVLETWKNRTIGKGPFVKHMYTAPGDYTVSVTVIEPSSGKESTAQMTVAVSDPDATFPGLQTICLSASGDFTGAPSGARQITAFSLTGGDPNWLAHGGSAAPVRWLFRRGEAFNLEVGLSSAQAAGMMFGAFGSGADPVLTVPSAGATGVNVYSSFPENGDLRLANLSIRGNFDPAAAPPPAGGGAPGHAVHALYQAAGNAMLSACRFAGFAYSTLSWAVSTAVRNNKIGLHLDDCVLTDFGGQYPTFFAPAYHPESHIAFTGCRVAQNPDAVDHSGLRAPVRIEHVKNAYFAGSDFFQTDSTQPVLKLQETPWADGGILNLHSCALEGPGNGLRFNGNYFGGLARSTVHNFILDGLVMVGGYGTGVFLISHATGITMRNCLCILPSSPRFGTTSFPRFIMISDAGSYDPHIVGAAPTRIYNNTMRCDRAPADNEGKTPVVMGWYFPNGDFPNISEQNNVLRLTNDLSGEPLSQTLLWSPRLKGYRNPSTLALDATYATPADAVKETRPMIGSPALGAALSGDVSYMDIELADRPEPPSQGAWEA